MKIAACAILVLPAVGAFAPSRAAFRNGSSRRLAASAVAAAPAPVVTGPMGKPAASFEEDLLLTLQIIKDHDARSVTVSKEQFISQMQEMKSIPEPEAPVDLTVPYDAAARLAYAASDKRLSFDAFKAKYEADAVAMVISKKPVDLRIPYDAAAVLAFMSSDRSTPFGNFKARYEAEAVAQVVAKKKARESS